MPNTKLQGKHRREVFDEGDVVLVFLCKRLSASSYNKLKLKKNDPCKILKKINNNTYIVDLLYVNV